MVDIFLKYFEMNSVLFALFRARSNDEVGRFPDSNGEQSECCGIREHLKPPGRHIRAAVPPRFAPFQGEAGPSPSNQLARDELRHSMPFFAGTAARIQQRIQCRGLERLHRCAD